jgi:hypothetical protein
VALTGIDRRTSSIPKRAVVSIILRHPRLKLVVYVLIYLKYQYVRLKM